MIKVRLLQYPDKLTPTGDAYSQINRAYLSRTNEGGCNIT